MKETNPFSKNIQDSILIHIPHSSVVIPQTALYTYNLKLLVDDLIKTTDLYTDIIFDTDLTFIKFPFSRLYLDVERFLNDPMDKYGRGFYTIKDSNGNLFRNNFDKENVEKLYKNYFVDFEKSVQDKIDNYGYCFIIDCHSFNNENLVYETANNKPDICIGTDSFHTPEWLSKYTQNFFIDKGFIVKENYPYSGSIVPLKFFNKDKRVYSIMIELNKKLYLNDSNSYSLSYLNKIFKSYIENLS